VTAATPFFNSSAESARAAGERLLAELQRSDADISAGKLLNLMGTNVDYNVTSEKSETPLLLAAQKGFFIAASRMVDYGADVNKPDQFGFTPFMMAASGNNRALVDALLNKNADINARSAAGDTAFTLTGGQGHNAMLKYLMEKGAVFTDSDGAATLTAASLRGYTDVVKTIADYFDAREHAARQAMVDAEKARRDTLSSIADTFRHGPQGKVSAPRTARFRH
jgi:ankyrin repeat protein